MSAELRQAKARGQTCKRVPVTAEWLKDHPDVQGYMYDEDKADLGLDPWLDIAGVDQEVHSGRIILEFGRTGERSMSPADLVFVSERDYNTEFLQTQDYSQLEVKVLAHYSQNPAALRKDMNIADPKLEELINQSTTPEQKEFWETVKRGYPKETPREE